MSQWSDPSDNNTHILTNQNIELQVLQRYVLGQRENYRDHSGFGRDFGKALGGRKIQDIQSSQVG